MASNKRDERTASSIRSAKLSLGSNFLRALRADFDLAGADALPILRETDPSTYFKLVASLLPREDSLNVNHRGSITHATRPISETAEFLTASIGDGAPRPPAKPVLN